MNYQRIRVIFQDEDKVARVETLGRKEPVLRDLLGGSVLSFASQEDGTIHLVSATLVQKVIYEAEDPRYGTWKVVDTKAAADF